MSVNIKKMSSLEELKDAYKKKYKQSPVYLRDREYDDGETVTIFKKGDFKQKFSSYVNKLARQGKTDIILNETYYLLDKKNKPFKFDIADKPFLKKKFGKGTTALDIIRGKVKGNKLFKSGIPLDKLGQTKIRGWIFIQATIVISDDESLISFEKPVEMTAEEISSLDTPPEINDIAHNLVTEWAKENIGVPDSFGWVGEGGGVGITAIRAVDFAGLKSSPRMYIEDGFMRLQQPLNLIHMYNEVVHTNYDDCVKDYLKSRYKRVSRDEIDLLETPAQIQEFCVSHEYPMRCYDVSGKVIIDYNPKNKKKALNFITYNSHLYPITNKKLSTVITEYKEIVYCKNIKKKLKEILDKGYIPANIQYKSAQLYSFRYKEEGEKDYTLYTNSKESLECFKILEQFNIKDKFYDTLDFNGLGTVLEDLYRYTVDNKGNKIEIKNSFMPQLDKVRKGGFNYVNGEMDTTDLVTIDMVKAYPSMLRNLDYLIYVDIKKHKNYEYSGQEIQEHYLYVIDPAESSIFFENADVYEGYTVIKALDNGLVEGVDFKILEVQETDTQFNFYRKMIDELYEKLDEKVFKTVMNVLIGKMEMNSNKRSYLNFDRVLDEQEAKCFDGYIQDFDEKYKIGLKPVERRSFTTNKPISIQIKDRTRLDTFETMNYIGLKDKDIKQIKTDAITFKKSFETQLKLLKVKGEDLGDWKEEKTDKFFKEKQKIKKEPPTFRNNFINFGFIEEGNAGCGKTERAKLEVKYIIDKMLDEDSKDDYLILSSSHATLLEYRKLGYKCDVIQKYIYGKLPTEDFLIVDEWGMIDETGWNTLYACALNGKMIHAYGDGTQLEPVRSGACDNKIFIDMMFREKRKSRENWRNNFTEEYYEKLKRMKKREDITKEINKHNTPYQEAEMIICMTNKYRIKYNELMKIHNNIENKTDKGAKLICRSNDTKQYNIYNNFVFDVIKSFEHYCMLYDGLDYYMVSCKDINKYFDYGYARTLYSVQGQSVKSFFYDTNDCWFKYDGRTLYTLISRLKQDLTEETIQRNKSSTTTKIIQKPELDVKKNEDINNNSILDYL